MLIFPLKAVWFDKIEKGEKTIEYREIKPYWTKRINSQYVYNKNPDFNKCILQRGYTKRRLVAEIKSINVVYGKNTDLNIPENVYAICLTNVKKIE